MPGPTQAIGPGHVLTPPNSSPLCKTQSADQAGKRFHLGAHLPERCAPENAMPTTKPRVTVTLDPYVHETIQRMATLQGRTRGAVIADLVGDVHRPLMRVVALMEAARDAPKQVKEGIITNMHRLEAEVSGLTEEHVRQLDMLLHQQQQGGGSEREQKPVSAAPPPLPNPHVVTRGSGHPTHTPKKPRSRGKNG